MAQRVLQPMTAVVVRDVRGADELRQCQAVQRRAWGITEDGYLVPVATMAGAQRVGGMVLGAFDSANRLVGFTFAFLGRLDGRLILYSQLAGVDPDQQGGGIGRLLKLEQRRRARDMGLDAVVWAFDPLQASNAAFNLAILGAIARTYEVDLYGSRTDALNVGLATDRLLAEWSTADDEPRGLADAWPAAPDLIETTLQPGEMGLRAPTQTHAPGELGSDRLRLEIPANLRATKRSPELARSWQTAVRQAFQSAFATGYTAVGFSRADPSAPRYLLERPRR
jgi:predicted GNAT superfamily acetyltransferase